MIDVVVSELVLLEVERNLVADFAHVEPARRLRRVADMRDFLQGHIVGVGDLDAPTGVINDKDRHVVAAAIAARADVLVTNDRRLRAEVGRSALAIRPLALDEPGEQPWHDDPRGVTQVLDAPLARRRRRPTEADFASALGRHVPTVAQAWRERRR